MKCLNCDKAIDKGASPYVGFCSRRCYKRSWYPDWRSRNPIQPKMKRCMECHGEFETFRKDNLLCSRKCIRARWNGLNRELLRDQDRVRYARTHVKLRCRLAQRMYQAVKGNRKSASTEKLTGCSIAELKMHLQSQFVPGMAWNNYGPIWHIDHRKPCAAFDLSKESEQRKCFHFSNLQPLFAIDNQSKGSNHKGKRFPRGLTEPK